MSDDVILGTAKVSASYKISLIAQVRPHLKLKPGDRVQFRLHEGLIIRQIIIEKVRG
jgi:hypothetical protein